MATMNISLPDGMKAFVDEQVEAKGYGTSSEYVRDLIRKDQDREALRAMLLDGGRSAMVSEPEAVYASRLRARAAGPAPKSASRTRKSGRR